LKFNKYHLLVFLILALHAPALSQVPNPTPAPDDKETILTEEIKLNATVFGSNGAPVDDLKKEDLVIIEDGRLQQADSARRMPANVLIMVDTGGEMRGNLSVSRAAAKNIVTSLEPADRISVFQYGDTVEMLCDWSTSKSAALDVLDKKLAFGRRSVMDRALDAAVGFFYKTPLENRHLILITGGLDSFNDTSFRDAVIQKLSASDINVHVISYAFLQKSAIAPRKDLFLEGEPRPKRLNEEVVIGLPDPKRPGKKQEVTWREMARMPRLGSMTLDRARIKQAKASTKELDAGIAFLSSVADDTNGWFILPESIDDVIARTYALAKIIDAQYVVTYSPKRPLKDSPGGEVRTIDVSSRRAGTQVEAHRKLRVEKKP
jgi:VWFA-related protein